MGLESRILRCPATGGALSIDPDNRLLRAEDGRAYSFADGIGRFLEPVKEDDLNKATRAFYDEVGWSKQATGLYNDTAKFVDTRAVSIKISRDGMLRLKKYFRRGGEFLLDAGCGPIPHDDLLDYGENFQKRVCVDLSVAALDEARHKLGTRGIYLQGDLSNLPVATDSVDAAMCYHVIYQLPPELQAKAFREIWRVLKPGGIAVVVYWWPGAKLAWRAKRLARIVLGPERDAAPAEGQGSDASTAIAKPDHNPLSLDWFESQPWPFRFDFDTYRIVDNVFLRNWIPDNWKGAAFLEALMLFQNLRPRYCGRNGEMPAIIIRKDARPLPG